MPPSNYEILNGSQFGEHFGEHGYHSTQRYIRTETGHTYRLQQESSGSMISAHPVGPKNDIDKKPAAPARGRLSWFGGKPAYSGSNVDGGVIYKTGVSPTHRRRGVATAMFDYAREANPDQDIRHSNALSEDGAAWAAKNPTENDLMGPNRGRRKQT